MRLVIVILIMICQVFFVNLSYAKDEIRKTGTFTNLSYYPEGGDLAGFEIRIVFARNGYEGTFQAAEGGPDSLFLLKNISIKNNIVRFSIPSDSYLTGEFVGKLSKTALIGTLTLSNGNKIELKLKRDKSYWD